MDPIDYYNDKKWCPTCGDYVAYLMSIEHSFCVTCGQEVRLFSEADWETFNESMQAKKPKGGRPRKKAADSSETPDRGRESA